MPVFDQRLTFAFDDAAKNATRRGTVDSEFARRCLEFCL